MRLAGKKRTKQSWAMGPQKMEKRLMVLSEARCFMLIIIMMGVCFLFPHRDLKIRKVEVRCQKGKKEKTKLKKGVNIRPGI